MACSDRSTAQLDLQGVIPAPTEVAERHDVAEATGHWQVGRVASAAGTLRVAGLTIDAGALASTTLIRSCPLR
jgi:hypothetical protein